MVDIRIIGAGVGGLMTAIGAVRHDLTPLVDEATTALGAEGAGILRGSNALAALERVDLAAPVERASATLDRIRILDPSGKCWGSFRSVSRTSRTSICTEPSYSGY